MMEKEYPILSASYLCFPMAQKTILSMRWCFLYPSRASSLWWFRALHFSRIKNTIHSCLGLINYLRYGTQSLHHREHIHSELCLITDDRVVVVQSITKTAHRSSHYMSDSIWTEVLECDSIPIFRWWYISIIGRMWSWYVVEIERHE